jgi:hypothetical protein
VATALIFGGEAQARNVTADSRGAQSQFTGPTQGDGRSATLDSMRLQAAGEAPRAGEETLGDRVGPNPSSVKVSDGIEIELSRIHTPDEAVSFVERFALLTYKVLFPESEYTDGKDTVPDDEIPREAAEPFEQTAVELREILHAVKLTRAAAEGDTSAHAALERFAQAWWCREAIPPEAETERIVALA